ncbi:MAG: HAD-IIB family hydrolase [Desulfobacterales bacterium]|nr:HAD-IIB family hydrolase [Desulfobacterales bacterium]
MKPLDQFSKGQCRRITHVLTDIDDTLTTEGRLPAAAYKAMEDLDRAGIAVIPITGRPAGWCDHIARMWPVKAVVGENGAFYFAYDTGSRKMIRHYARPGSQREADQRKLEKIRKDVLTAVPGCIVSADQAYREADLAIDFCEDVPALASENIDRIVDIFHSHGATAKISSIHVNGWFGTYDKLTMTRTLFRDYFSLDLDRIKDRIVFSGDSPNDAPMFAYFPRAVGVANIKAFADMLSDKPAFVTRHPGGLGFAELARRILKDYDIESTLNN